MLWIQSGVCFLGWLGFGVWLARGRGRLPVPGFVKKLYGAAACLILGAVELAGGIWMIAKAGGLQNGSLLPWAWVSVFVVGTVFVQLQSWGAIGLVTLALRRETQPPGQASLAKEDSE